MPQLYDARPGVAAGKRWMRDTTYIIEALERDDKVKALNQPGSVIPLHPASRFLSSLLEDYADDCLWRMGMYFRWVCTMCV